jgi:hypothetical protein
MLVAEVLRDYKLPVTARWLIEAYSEITAKPQTTEPPGAKHARWYLRRNRNSAAHVRGMQGYLAARALLTSRPPHHGARNSASVGGVVGQPTRDTNYVAMPMNFERTKETTERQGGDWLPGASRLAANPPLDQTEPRLEIELRATDNVMAAGNTYYSLSGEDGTGHWARRQHPLSSKLS